MPARLPVFRPDPKRDSERETRRAVHASAWEAATGRITRHVVAEIGKPGMRLLEEIADGKKRGPAEVIEQVVDVARDHKSEIDAVAPVRALAHRLGYELAPLVPIVGELPVDAAAARAGKEFGDAIGAAIHAGRREFNASPAAAEREIAEAIAALHALREACAPRPRSVEIKGAAS